MRPRADLVVTIRDCGLALLDFCELLVNQGLVTLNSRLSAPHCPLLHRPQSGRCVLLGNGVCVSEDWSQQLTSQPTQRTKASSSGLGKAIINRKARDLQKPAESKLVR